MDKEKVNILERALLRERKARKQAEKILEVKSLELFNTTIQLEKANTKLEHLLVEKTSQLKGVFKNINDAYCIIDFSGKILEMNDSTIQLLGCNNDEEELNLKDFLFQSNINEVLSDFLLIKEKGELKDFKIQIISRDNIIKDLNINASLVINDEGDVFAIQGIARDITIENVDKNKLLESENRLKNLILNLNNAIFLEDENRVALLVNKKLCDLFYMPESPEQYIGQDMSNGAEQSKLLFENPNEFVIRYEEIIEKREVVLGEEIRMADGKILERNYIPVYKNGVFKGQLWSFNDVTLERNFYRTIEAQKQKYGDIIANMNLGLLEVNNEGEILLVNQSFSAMSGYSEKELIGEKAIKLFPLNVLEKRVKQEQLMKVNEESKSFEITAKTKKGEKRFWLVSRASNYNVNGKITGAVEIYLDITDLKNLEIQKGNLLNKLEKSNSELQEYAHIVSHDLKSPLRSISALTNWIKTDNKEKFDDFSLQNFDDIENTLEVMDNLISSILEYSSITSGNEEVNEEVDFNFLIKELKTVLYIPENISVNILNTLPVIKGDKVKFQQLFQNLISNAIKFNNKEKGIINIKVNERSSFYEFSVSDNGMGIEKKHFDKIFKIFQSLKKAKNSSGIGLSIVKKIVSLYKGEIWLESEINKGTTFYFTIKK